MSELENENKNRRNLVKNVFLQPLYFHPVERHVSKAMGGALLSRPWRDLPNKEENLKFLKRYQTDEANRLRILLHGPTGAGKSSFINSVESVLQGKVSSRALTDATSGKSFTKRYKTYKIRKGSEGFYSFIFNDIMGFEDSSYGIHEEDVIFALKGHVKDDYEFKTDRSLSERDNHYISSPTLDDQAHVLVSVIPAGSVSLLSDEVVRKMRETRSKASDMGIPQLAVLTKVDEACPKANEDIKNVYKSKYLKEKVDQFSKLLGLPLNCIFLVKNYETKTNINDDIDKLILGALRQMINFGEDFLNNQ